MDESEQKKLEALIKQKLWDPVKLKLEFWSGFESLPAEPFQGLTQLKSLSLTLGKLGTETLPAIFHALTQLETVELWTGDYQQKTVGSLPIDIFEGFSQLQSLKLDFGKIEPESLPEILLRVTQLKSLSLSVQTIRMETLQATFHCATALTYLSLNVGKIESFPDGLFHQLTQLQGLSLTLGTESLPVNTFQGLTQLNDLSLEVKSVPIDIFQGFRHLKSLSLRSGMTTLPSGIFSALTALQRLNLDHGSWKSFPGDLLQGLSNLESINLGFNNDLETLPSGLFDGLYQLIDLNLRNTIISTLPADIFRSLTRLQELHLHKNQLQQLPSGIFHGLGRLGYLFMFNSKLKSLDSDVFRDLTNLQELQLSLNPMLESLPHDIFNGLTQLNCLGLCIPLTSLPVSINSLPALQTLFINDDLAEKYKHVMVEEEEFTPWSAESAQILQLEYEQTNTPQKANSHHKSDKKSQIAKNASQRSDSQRSDKMAGWPQICKDDSVHNWALMELEGQGVKDVTTGNGLASLRAVLDDTKIQFVALKVMACDELIKSPKFIQINWIGQKVPAMKRIGALSAKPLIGEVFTSIAVFVDLSFHEAITTKSLAQRLLGAGGAHKPLFYDFGDEKFTLESL